MKVVCVRPEGRGWDTVDLFAALAADLLDATLVVRIATGSRAGPARWARSCRGAG